MGKINIKHALILSPALFIACNSQPKNRNQKPNILFIIADDASLIGTPETRYIKTPNFDRLADEGVLFTNAYCTDPKCSPARASILTGRYSWQLEEASVHYALMPEKWRFYPEILEENGYFTGYTGKGWGPGIWTRGEHNPAGRCYDSLIIKPPFKGISNKDYCENFRLFLNAKDKDKPFCFWIGTHEPHRPYEKDSYIKDKRDINDVQVPMFLPDNKIIRGDLLDYALEVEWYDQQIGKAMKILEELQELDNTIIIATSDHGFPFPYGKSQINEEGCHVGFAVRWGDRIKPGRIVHDFINFPDIAPTFLEAAGLKPHPQMTGKSFLNLLLSNKSGWISFDRRFSLLGRETHGPGRDDGEKVAIGYPVRAIRTRDFLYVKNYEQQRWPSGNPEHGYPECAPGPSKDYILSVSKDSLHPDFRYYELSLSFREKEELYDMKNDKHCINNLAEIGEFEKIKNDLADKLQKELVKQKDPRSLGNGEIFDTYYYMDFVKTKKMHGEHFQVPEHLKKYK